MKFARRFSGLSFLMAGCSRRDGKIQQRLAGTCVVELEHDMRSTRVVQSDGSYHCEVRRFSDGRTVSLEGTLLVKDGGLIDTTTKNSQTDAGLPFVMHGRIIHMDDRELVTRWDGDTKDTVAHRIQK